MIVAGFYGAGYGGLGGFGGYGGYGGFGGLGGYGGFGGYGFWNTLSPGIPLIIQYDLQPPAFGIFQGFQDGLVVISNYNGFPGLVRIPIGLINAVSPWGGGFGGFGYRR